MRHTNFEQIFGLKTGYKIAVTKSIYYLIDLKAFQKTVRLTPTEARMRKSKAINILLIFLIDFDHNPIFHRIYYNKLTIPCC